MELLGRIHMTILTETRTTYADGSRAGLNPAPASLIGTPLNNGVTTSKLPGKAYLIPFLLVFYADWVGYTPKKAISAAQVAHELMTQHHSLIGFENDPRQLIVRGSAYLLALALVIKRFPASLRPLASNPWFAVLTLYILSSMAWSAFPAKVFINFGHAVGVGLVVLNLRHYFQERTANFYWFLARVLLPVLLVSLVACIAFPTYAINIPDAPGRAGRWYGITNNSNTLALLAMVFVWASMGSWISRLHRNTRLWSSIFLVLGLIILIGTQSATSLTIAAMMAFGMPFLLSLDKNGTPIRVAKLGGFVLVGGLLLLLAVIFVPERLEAHGFFALLGRSATLSGRTKLWDEAFSLIQMKPWLGWSFDSNASVLTRGAKEFGFVVSGQFHNGYIDMMVRGGRIGLLLALLMIFGLIRGLVKYARRDFRDATIFLVLAGAILLHNVTEATLARETSFLWLLMVYAYLCLGRENAKQNSKSLQRVA